jgi:hypothetical protein
MTDSSREKCLLLNEIIFIFPCNFLQFTIAKFFNV